jgi:glycosyltransferase involved in cell wall biosynthesis
VIIVPLRVGGGTRLKIVEAMAKGKAIVTTRIGAEGLDLVHGTHALFADSPAEFAAEVERLLADPELAQRLGRAARALALERYSWRAVVRTLESFYLRLSPELSGDVSGAS